MTSANTPKPSDLEKQLLGAITSTPSTRSSSPAKSTSSTMSKLYRLTFGLLLLATLCITFTSATARRGAVSDTLSVEESVKFQELLDSVDPTSLHNVLHEHMADRYQDGVYQEDKKAMEVVHQSNSAVAHSLLELARRQATNATTSTSVSTTPPTSTPTTSVADTATSSDTPASSTSVPPATTSPSQTQSQSQTQTQTSQDTSPAQTTTRSTTAVVQSPSVSQSTVASTESSTPQSSTNGSPSASKQSTTTPNGKQSSASSRASVTQQTIYTTTFADGAVSTVTSITIVPAAQADTTAGATKTGGQASLQTNGANADALGLRFGGVLGVMGLVVIGAL